MYACRQASHAAREQQAADRLAAAQRDVGDLQVPQLFAIGLLGLGHITKLMVTISERKRRRIEC